MIKSFLVFIFISMSICLAQDGRNINLDQELDRVVKLTYGLNFDDAFNLIEIHLTKDPPNLVWKYMRAMVTFRKSLYLELNGEIKSYDNHPSSNRFDLAISEFRDVAHQGDEIISHNLNDTLALFFTGASYGYIGLCHALNGDKFKAASEGKRGLDYHDRLIKLCPSWADAYFGLAIFNYYASNVPWYMKPVLWILKRSGSEEKAIKYFTMVIQHGRLARYEALEMLIKLYIHKGELALAKKNIDELINLVPEANYYYSLQFAIEFKRYEMPLEANQILIHVIELSKSVKLLERDKETLGHVYMQLALNYKMKDEFNKAVITLKDLVDRKLLPEEESLCYSLMGDCYSSLGNRDKADSCYKRVSTNGKEKQLKMQTISK